MSRDRKRTCPAGVWTKIYSSTFTAVPSEWTVRFEPAQAGGTLSGKITEKRTLWILPGSEETRDLAPEVRIVRRWINTFYTVKVKPDSEVTATLTRDSMF